VKYDVIIIGAGAAGLIAMLELLREGYSICMLEASPIAGGRIATIKEDGFAMNLETGAEFIHGKLPLTIRLLKDAGISYHEVKGEMFGVQNGNWKNDEHNEYWDEFMSKLKKLKTDITILEFLNDNFSNPKYTGLRKDVQRLAEGFDLADISRASVLSIKDEWKNIEKKQYRVEGGYGGLINYLLNDCVQLDARIYYNSSVNRIRYNKSSVNVSTTDGRNFDSDKIIVTASVGVLQSGAIRFDPELTDHAIAIQGLGFGTVIKFLLQFKTDFWKEYEDDIGFILSNEEVPTWWTQLPMENSLLTGWMGGAKATERVFHSDDELLGIALGSLASIFQMPVSGIKEQLECYKILNWQNNANIKGGYSFNTLSTKEAKRVLANPVNEVIYFAGEAVSQGEAQGTVESALQSGKDVAAFLIRHLKRSR